MVKKDLVKGKSKIAHAIEERDIMNKIKHPFICELKYTF